MSPISKQLQFALDLNFKAASVFLVYCCAGFRTEGFDSYFLPFTAASNDLVQLSLQHDPVHPCSQDQQLVQAQIAS